MTIRLNKAIRELNIGLQTAVEFLKKRSELGEVRDDLNFKLSEEQYHALVEAFKTDKEARNQAEKLLLKHPKEKKRPAEKKEQKVEQTSPESRVQKFKPIGKIDLDNIGKKPATQPVAEQKTESPVDKNTVTAPKQETAKPQQPVAEVKTEPNPAAAPHQAVQEKKEDKGEKTEKPHGKETVKPVQKQDNKKADTINTVQKSQPMKEDKKKHVVATGTSEKGVNTDTTKEDGKIFTLKSEKKLAPKVNVLGKIDLDALNQSTRPKKKSKEERRKEREEKAAQTRPDGKKKRSRITKERVNIDQAVKQNNNEAKQEKAANPKKKNRKRNHKPLEVNEEDVARQVKETLARLTSKGQNKKGAKYRKEKREAVQEQLKEQRAEAKAESKILKLTEFVTVSELANMMNVSVNQVIGTCMSVGIMVSINQRLDAETINLVAEEFDFKTEYVSAEVSEAITEEEDDENDLLPRAPIVTVMGHVDHGKTSLLDHIRNTNVIAGEAGGITQHIGAYNVTLGDGRQITFLDTPGHEAFTAMRARGAQVTDIAIIIIAADDSVMPTTREAIAHAQAANVPMVFAINKIDKPGANPDKIREDLANMNLLVEEWGGKYQCQEISAKKGIGVDDLLEKVLLEAEMLDLKANPNRKATGSVIESSLDKGRGYVATVLVSNGTLRVGDMMLAGTNYGRVKAMFDERGRRIEEIGPSQAATILGLNGAPTAGDTFHIMESDQEAREIATKREQLAREQGLRTMKRVDLNEIGRRIALGDFQELNLLVKGDVDGSIEALKDSFERLSTEKIKVNVIYKAVGQISESDVTLAAASDAIIIAFQVRPSAQARRLAEQEGVDIRQYSVIYDAIEEVKDAMEGMLSPEIKEEITAQVEVRQVYHISKVGTVAGAYVIDGKVSRTNKARVIRDGIVIFTGAINALKRFKDDVKEVTTNFECGISLVNYNDLREGDIIETFAEVEVKAKL